MDKPKTKLYMVCDWTDKRAAEIDAPVNIGTEYLGECDGRGDECKVVPGGLFGKECYVPCRMCAGTGRLYLTTKEERQ